MSDIGTWLTVDETAKRAGVTPRGVLDWVRRKKLHPRKYKRPGKAGAAVSLFDPEEVDALVADRIARKTEILPAAPASTVPMIPSLAQIPVLARAAGLAKLAAAAERKLEMLSAARLPLWLRYDEAVTFTGLAESRLRELVAAGQVRTEHGPRGAIVLCRADLERLGHSNGH